MVKRLITDKTLKEKLGGCSDMTIWRLRRDGKLPKPKKLGSRNVTPEDEADKAIAKLVGLEFS
jgi:predicted DNA-binding transcriptional regulator AlpA